MREWFPISFMGSFTDWAYVTHGAEKEFGQLTCGCHPNCGVGMAIMIDKETKEAVPVTKFLKAEQLAKDIASVTDAGRGRFLSVFGMALSLVRNYDPFQAPTHFKILDLLKKFDKTFGATQSAEKGKYGKVEGDRTVDDIKKRRADRWNFLFIAGMWFQDLFNYDFRRTEMCIIPYATQQGEISFCAYNTGVGWRNIIEKMHMTATLTKWYDEHGRHEIFAGNKAVPLPTLDHKLALNAEAVVRPARRRIWTTSGIAKERARREAGEARPQGRPECTTRKWRASIARRSSRNSRRCRFRALAARRRRPSRSFTRRRNRTNVPALRTKDQGTENQKGRRAIAGLFLCLALLGGGGLGRRRRMIFDHHVADDRNRPAWRCVSGRAVETLDRELLAEDAHLRFAVRNHHRNRFCAGRRDGLDARYRTGASRQMRSTKSRSPFLELLFSTTARADQRVVHRERPDGGRVARVRPVRFHLLFRIGVAVVQIERQRHGAPMLGKFDDDAGRDIARARS